MEYPIFYIYLEPYIVRKLGYIYLSFTLAAHGLEDLFPVVLLVVSVFGSGGKLVLVLNTYVLRVQYSCGVVLVFLVLAGNSFLCYVCT
jgi:hypothetical protein